MTRPVSQPSDLATARADLSDRLGYTFQSAALYDQALTHSSVGSDRLKSNERLEFLGDRVLGLTVSHMLFDRFPAEREGRLAYRFTALVRKETLAEVAESLDIGQAVEISAGEEVTGGRTNPAILADACEALIGALYLDGGFQVAHDFVERHWRTLLDRDAGPLKDPKTRLQERVQGMGMALPVYEIVGRDGPDHAPQFRSRVVLADGQADEGTGGSKREAEQAAAEALLAGLGEEGTPE